MACASKSSRLNLHEALSQRTYHHAVLCTYTFDPHFFEGYCLDHFTALSNNNNISVCTDRGTYHKLVHSPESQRPKLVNLRYLLSPIDTNGRFHSKVFLLCTKTSGRLIIGSANFTRAGLTSNAELVDVFDFEVNEQEHFLGLFQDVLSFITALADRWPMESLASNVGELLRGTPWLGKDKPSLVPSLRLLHNLDESLWQQILQLVKGPVDQIHVVSRFFDDSPALIDKIMLDFKPKKLSLYTQNGVTTMTAKWLKHPYVKSGRVEIFLCTYEDDGHQQPLHAKATVFESGSTKTIVYGSANFTTPALLMHGKAGNIETMVVVPPVAAKDFNSRLFCDPSRSAHLLRTADQLKSAPKEKPDHVPAMPIRLIEAVLDEHNLMMNVDPVSTIWSGMILAKLHLNGSRGITLPVSRAGKNRLVANVPEKTLARLQESSSLISLETTDQEKLSNTVFLTNLIDIKTQNNVRRERRIVEATESAAQFFAVLNDLLGGEDSALLTFLSFCDIPLVNAPRPPGNRARAVWDGQEGMRQLGLRNLQICKTLHEATLRFFDRHLRKLKRHMAALTLDGVLNYLQIFLSMGSLLRMQIERVIIALEADEHDVSTETWGECRDLWDVYFIKFRELMECLWEGYLQPLRSEHSHEDIQREFGQDLDAIHELCNSMIQYRIRIEKIRTDKCLSRRPGKSPIPFGYFDCVLGPEKWKRYSGILQQRQQCVEIAVHGRTG
jgi:HKD family nuclease